MDKITNYYLQVIMEYFTKLYAENENELKNYKILVIANVRTKTLHFKNCELCMANDNEFFSIAEFDEIITAIRSLNLFTKVYYSELDFFDDILSQRYNPKKIIVINFARNGTSEGKKSLVPCFCDLLNIKYTGSNAFTQSICRNKYFWNSILIQEQLPALKCFYYQGNNNVNVLNHFLKDNCDYIVKPVSESSSMGVTCKMNKNEVLNYVKNKKEKLLIQKYLIGQEVEVPFYELNGTFYPLPPQIINYDGNLLDEKLSLMNDYYYTQSNLPSEINKYLIETTIKTAQILGIRKYGRIDFKLDEDNCPHIIDIATLPYITRNSSFGNAIKQQFKHYEIIFQTLLLTALLSKIK